MSTDRLPPHALESEQGVIGSILISPTTCLNETIVKLGSNPEVFYDPRHQVLYFALIAMGDDNIAIDSITLHQKLKDRGELADAGGLAYLAELQNLVPSTAQLPVYIEEVLEKFLLRKLLQVCTLTQAKIYQYSGTVDDLLDESERDVLEIRGLRNQPSGAGIKELVKQALNNIESIWERQGAISGIPTGLADLDRLTDGLVPGQMVVIAGYPGAGKTALALNIAEHVAVIEKLPVGIFSLEMSAPSLVTRLMFSNSKLNSRSVRDHTMTDSDFKKLTTTAGRLSTAPLHIDESNDLSIYELRAKARRMSQQHQVKLIVVDYLQLLHAAGSGRKVESRQQEVTDISRGIKAMARELAVPVIALSQLNDDGKLRESRAIGQDADSVWILRRDEKAETSPEVVAVNVDIAKQRNGPVGTVDLTFLKSFTRFENAARVID